MSGITAILKLTLPAFDQTPWDTDVNNDLVILDAAVGKFFGAANMAGVWQNSITYTIGQVVVDATDGSMWSCAVMHISAVAPTTFAQERANVPGYWVQAASTAQEYATQAQNYATSAAISATNAANSAASAVGGLPLTGGTMTGLLILSGDPTTALGAATKQYVDARVGGVGFLQLSGGTMTGFITLSGNPTAALHAVTKQYADTKMPISGGTFTGDVTGNGRITAMSTLTGQLGVFANPTSTFGMYVTGTTAFIHQFGNTGFFWSWSTSNGDMVWYTANQSFLYMRTSDALIFNNIGTVGGRGAYLNLSDERVKHDVKPLSAGLTELSMIEPIWFTRVDGDMMEIGFSAQNVLRAIPEAVREFKDGLLGVSGEMILAVAVNAIRELDQRVIDLETSRGT